MIARQQREGFETAQPLQHSDATASQHTCAETALRTGNRTYLSFFMHSTHTRHATAHAAHAKS
jgi:hypothetical protein